MLGIATSEGAMNLQKRVSHPLSGQEKRHLGVRDPPSSGQSTSCFPSWFPMSGSLGDNFTTTLDDDGFQTECTTVIVIIFNIR